MKMLKWILRRKLLVLACLAVMMTSNAQNTKYIESHKDIASELSEQFGIPQSVIMAIAIVESSSGVGQAAKILHNHFGIVGSKHIVTKGYSTKYKKYDSESDSFIDFCEVISRKNFYNKLKNNNDPKKWVKAISKAGYSSLPQVWEKRVLKTISTNRL